MLILKIILLVIGSYFVGNLNFALIISRLMHKNLRSLGSGNPGTMNMLRNFGVKIGALTLLLDVLKGAVPCLIGWWILGEPYILGKDKLGLFIAALCVTLGHIYPVFLKFKGGKGIASTIGVCLVAEPLITTVFFVIGVIFLLLTKIGSLTSFIVIFFPLAYSGFNASKLYIETNNINGIITASLVMLLFCLTLFAHRKNVYKLFSGTENLTSIKFSKSKSKIKDNIVKK